jgi:hypothetical protein
MIPNFRAQGLITRDHDLGAAMSQGPEHRLPHLSTSAGTFASESVRHVLRPARREHRAGRLPALVADHPR